MKTALLLSVASGILLTAGFPLPEMYFLSWIALIPLFWALREKSPAQAFVLGYVCGMTHFATTLHWIRYVLYHYGGLPIALAVLALLLVCFYLAVYPAVFAFVAKKWENRPLLWVLGVPCLWVTLEWIRAYALTGFPWANLGYSQTSINTLIQLADVTGVYGISWLIVLCNTALFAVLRKPRDWYGAAIFAACLVGTVAYGSWRIDGIQALQKQATPWTVAVLQGNVDQSMKWDKEFQRETLKRYRDLAQSAAKEKPQPDLLVWPETAVPFFYGVEESLTAQVQDMVRDVGLPELFGSPAVTLVDGKPRLQNRAYLVDGKGNVIGGYAKRHLVPFGEYVPLKKVLFFVSRLVEAAGDFVPGADDYPLAYGNQKIGVLICYEGIFPYLARSTVLRGATSLVNITNDAWYGRTGAPYQHMQMATWRAIEFRVPLIRAANTGISTIVDATGKLCGTIPLEEKGILSCTVHPFRTLTLYARWGDAFALICFLTTVGGIMYSARWRD